MYNTSLQPAVTRWHYVASRFTVLYKYVSWCLQSCAAECCITMIYSVHHDATLRHRERQSGLYYYDLQCTQRMLHYCIAGRDIQIVEQNGLGSLLIVFDWDWLGPPDLKSEICFSALLTALSLNTLQHNRPGKSYTNTITEVLCDHSMLNTIFEKIVFNTLWSHSTSVIVFD